MREIELKLLVPEGQERRLRRRLGAQCAVKPVTRRLHTVYLDTATGALGAAKIALRLRREGRGWTQTVKAGRALRAGLAETQESNARVPGARVDLSAIPEPDLRAAVERTVDGLPLAPVYETDIRRTTWTLPHDGAEIELALDCGEVRAGDAAAALTEVELELLSGAPDALFDLARVLFPEGGLLFSTLSKAERGRLLVDEGRIFEASGARKARPVAVARDEAAEIAGRDLLGECFQQIAENVGVLARSDHPEGPHQLRVGLRRLRSALELTRPAFDGPAHRALEAEARWLGQEVGALRDLDVALVDLVEPARAEAPQEPGFDALAKAVADRGAVVRARVRETLDGPRVHRFLFDLSEYIALRGWLNPADHGQTARLAQPFEALAVTALDRGDARAAKRARGIADLDHEARHALRKALKRQRYTLEFAAPLWPEEKTKPLIKALKALQELFGDLNDAAVAEALFLAPDAPAADDPTAARAAGRLIGSRNAGAEHSWEEAQRRWHAFATAPRPWRKKGAAGRKKH